MLESVQGSFDKYDKESFFVIIPAAMNELDDIERAAVIKTIDRQFATMREQDELGTGNVVVDHGPPSPAGGAPTHALATFSPRAFF